MTDNEFSDESVDEVEGTELSPEVVSEIEEPDVALSKGTFVLPDTDSPVEDEPKLFVGDSEFPAIGSPHPENVDEPVGEVTIEITGSPEIELEVPDESIEDPADTIAEFMSTIPSAADDPAEDIILPENGKVVNFDVRAPGKWPGGSIRAGVEGEQVAGYGNTRAEALEDLRASVRGV